MENRVIAAKSQEEEKRKEVAMAKKWLWKHKRSL